MKVIIQLFRAINENPQYYTDQFNRSAENNILFINPVLSGNGLYHHIKHYIDLRSETTHTAMIGLQRYEGLNNYFSMPADPVLSGKELSWANKIVFPFTAINLLPHFEQIKSVGKAQIFYCLDFNFYELPAKHPYSKHFTSEVIETIEQNIINSDTIFVYNIEFQQYLSDKFNKYLSEGGKYYQHPINFKIKFIPFLLDSEICLENVEYSSEAPIPIKQDDIIVEPETIEPKIDNNDIKQKITEASDTVKRKKPTKKNIKNGKKK